MNLPNARELPYWKTSRSSGDDWLAKTSDLVENYDGVVLGRGMGRDPMSGNRAWILSFEMDGASYRIVWPVLPADPKDQKAAERQAATMLFHDTKARLLSSLVLGSRAALMTWLELGDGRIAAQVADGELARILPSTDRPPALPARSST